MAEVHTMFRDPIMSQTNQSTLPHDFMENTKLKS